MNKICDEVGPPNGGFADPKIVKCISQLCLQNWPTSAITWASTPAAHKDAVWAEFTKRYRWADEDGSAISTLFWQKYADRTKDNLAKECQKALENAGIDHPGSGVLYMHDYSPWWCSANIWGQMCDQWREEKWVKKRSIGAGNRSSGAPDGKAKGTYRGGSISQLQHVTNKESESEGTPIDWLEVYVSTRDGIPEAQKIADDYRHLMSAILRAPKQIDQELWERASIVKKNYVKAQGQRRRSSFSGSFSGSGSSQSSQSSRHPLGHSPADWVRAICQNRELLRILAFVYLLGILGLWILMSWLVQWRRQHLHSEMMTTREHIMHIMTGMASLVDLNLFWSHFCLYCDFELER